MKNVVKIAITGGPCGGKTKAINWIANHYAEKGYGIIVVPETATELIMSGIAPWTCPDVKTFQLLVLRLQLQKEVIYFEAAEYMDQENVLIILDRGAMDGKAYTTEEEFNEILEAEGITESEIMSRYDAVIHMVTAAKGMPEHYSSRSNEARTETAETAAELDDRIIQVWETHPQHRIIDSKPKVEEKFTSLAHEIAVLLKYNAEAN